MADTKETNSVGRPPTFATAEELQAKIEEYRVQLNGAPEGWRTPTITGLAYFLGFESRQSFYDYEEKPEFSYTVKRSRLWIESWYESRLSGNNPTGSIFALKNMGWKDKTEQDLNHTGITFNLVPAPGCEPIKEG